MFDFQFYDVTTVCLLRNKMASTGENERFASLSSEDLQSLLENRDSSNTKQCVEAAKRVLDQFCTAKELDSGRFLKIQRKELQNFYKISMIKQESKMKDYIVAHPW